MLVGRAGLSPTMVGRSAALARLTGLLTSAGPGEAGEDGRPAVALVAGEAGIGKTRLLRELVRTVPPRAAVLAGQAEPGALGRPYELVRSLLGDLPPTGDDQLRSVIEAIEQRLGNRPALVVFDDLHWADAESVAVFERLAGLSRPSLVLVGTYRPEELTRRVPAAEVLARLERRQQMHQLRLDRLTRTEVAAFLVAVYERQLPSKVVETLFNRTGGNPFFLEELLIAAGDCDPNDLCVQPLPWSLSEVVQRQLDGLSPEERRVVEATAVLGRRASFDVVAGVTGWTEDELIVHLRALVDRGLLLEEDDDRFSFRHALVRDAVEGQLLGRERRRLHAVALATLKEQGSADLARLAHHAAGAGEYDELLVLAREGVDHYLRQGSSHQALVLALAALPEAPDDVVLLEGAARAAWLTGQPEEAVPYAERWERLARRDGDLDAESAALRLLARLLHEVDREDDLWAKVAEIEALAERLPAGEERAKNLACLAQVNMLTDHPEEAVAWADRAIEEADAAGAKQVRAQAMVERGSALSDVPGRFEEGYLALTEAVEEAEAVGDWVLLARALNNMAKYVPSGVPQTLEMLARMREAADRAGFDTLRATVPLRAARYAVAVGDAGLVRANLDEAHALLPGTSQKGSWCGYLDAFLLLEQDRLDVAADVLAHIPGSSDLDERAWEAVLLLQLAARRGERRDDSDALIATSASYGYPIEALEAVLDNVEVAAQAGLAVGELAAAVVEPWVARVRPRAEHVAVVDGVLAALGGRPSEAVSGLQLALTEPELYLPAFRLAALQGLLARVLVALGRRPEALAEARAALARLERWPGWRRAELEDLVERLAGPPSGPVGDDAAASLSPREREVAALLAEGLSNAELARRLYISPKTAAVHVSNILAKLGMSSRTEVAAWAVRTGLAGEAEPA